MVESNEIIKRVFIGCSSVVVGKGIANSLRRIILEDDRFSNFEIQVWDETVWENLKTAIGSLEENMVCYDYAIFIGYPDDLVEKDGGHFYTTRDNVTFEFGLFLSHLGSDRVFFFRPEYSNKVFGFKIMSDLGDSALVHLYDLGFEGDDFVFKGFRNIGQLLEQMQTTERKSRCDPDKDKLDNKVGLIKGLLADMPDQDRKRQLAIFKKNISEVLYLKSAITKVDLIDIIGDMLDTIKDVEDICKPGRIAELQSYDRGVTEVWVFADEPLEFHPSNHKNEGLNALREKVKDNLRKGVRYVYFVSSRFDKMRITDNFSKDREVLKNLELVYIDPKYFKTYYTIHHIYDESSSTTSYRIYMSSLLKHRDDFMIQISDSSHIDRILERIKKLKGVEEESYGIRTTKYTVD